MKKTKKAKRPITYSEAHNKAVKMYQKTSIFLLWAGVVNVLAIVIGIIQMSANSLVSGEGIDHIWPSSGFAMNFSGQIILNKLIITSMDSIIADILMIIIAVILGGAFVAVGYFAAKGKRWLLFLGSGIYALDFGAMFFVYQAVPMVWTNYAFTLVTHIVILIACLIAIVEYYNVIHIEKVFKGKNALNVEEEVESEVIAHGE